MKKTTIEEIQKIIDDNSIYHTIVLSNESEKILCKCGICSDEFRVTLSKLKRNTYKVCKNCARKIQHTKLSKIEEIKQEVVYYGFTPLFDKFYGVHEKLKVSDEFGYIGELPIVNIRKGSKISLFAKYNNYAIQNLRTYCINNGINCTIPDQEYNGYDSEIDVICSCGRRYKVSVTHFICDNQIRCSYCSKSKSSNEQIVECYLKEIGVEYSMQHRFEDCVSKRTLPFDFYLKSYNMCIEVDGEQHYKPIKFHGITDEEADCRYKTTKQHDKIKDEYCQNNHITLLRISYIEIKNKKYKEIISSYIH